MAQNNTNLPVKVKQIGTALAQHQKSIESVLPDGMDVKRFCRMALNAIIRNPVLADCNQQSFVLAVINAGEMGLEIGLGQAALVPYKGIVQCQPMYQGLMELARRSGQVTKITAEVVRHGDEFSYTLGLTPTLHHVPKATQGAALTHAYAVATLTNGDTQFVVLDKSEVDKIKRSSMASRQGNSPWQAWEEEMWKKTVLKRLCKMLPRSVQMTRALDLDDTALYGKMQTPAMANIPPEILPLPDMLPAGSGEGMIQQPKEKEPAKAESKPQKKRGRPKKQDSDTEQDTEPSSDKNDADVIDTLIMYEERLSLDTIQKARETVGITEGEAYELIEPEKLEALAGLYKAAMNTQPEDE